MSVFSIYRPRIVPPRDPRLPAGAPKKTDEVGGVTCAVCGQLQCLCRPRFFPGQLLSDEDLTALDHYILEKNRLHNRNLHGFGVVCGLKVLCHPCEGYVTVTSGHAIDPCGNDIIVCEDEPWDLIGRIRECRRKRPTDECDPWRFHEEPDCKDQDEEWCITIRYVEREARPMGALRSVSTRKSCSCTPGAACSCGCDSGSGKPKTRHVTTPAGIAACEPTRICEDFILDVVRAPEGAKEAAGKPAGIVSGFDAVGEVGGSSARAAIVGGLTQVPVAAVSSLSGECYGRIAYFVKRHRPVIAVSNDPDDARRGYRLCCRYREALVEFLSELSFTRCRQLYQLKEMRCPPYADDVNPAEYLGRLRQIVDAMTRLLLQYYQDCVCLNLLPDCPPPTQDNCVLLARVTVRNDTIVDICHFTCRQQLIGVRFLLHALERSASGRSLSDLLLGRLADVCCDGRAADTKYPERMLGRVAMESVAAHRAMSRMFSPSPAVWPLRAEAEETDDTVRLSPLRGMDVKAVSARMEAEGIDYTFESADEVPENVLGMIIEAEPDVFARDETVVLHTVGDTVVAFDQLSELAEVGLVVQLQARQLERMRGELDDLRAIVTELTGGGHTKSGEDDRYRDEG